MLDTFLEQRIQKKLQLYNILRIYGPIDIKKINESIESSESITRSLIQDLNHDFKGLARVKKQHQFFSLVIYDDVMPLKLLHSIYKDSTVLQCLKFMITNDTHEPYLKFIEESFYSTASAYRIKKNCQEYLRLIGLDVANNKVVGEEYRIRYLIALLYYKYGIECHEIDDESVKTARNFILSTNQAIDSSFLEASANEYGYFECLLILSWKRKDRPPFSGTPSELEELKDSFIYHDMRSYLRENIEIPLNIKFSEMDYDYIFLIYCSTNSCVLADKWTYADIDYIRQTIFSHTEFSNLLERIESEFKINIAGNRAMRAALIYFYKKSMLNLQCIIPDKYFYLDSIKNPFTLKIIHQVTELLDSWREDNHIEYPFDDAHIVYLSLQIESILRQFMKPVPVIVATDLIVELEVMKLALERHFSTHRTTITEFLVNAQNMDSLHTLKDCVIVINEKFRNVTGLLGLSEQNAVVPVTIELNSNDLTSIQEAVTHYEEKNLIELIGNYD